MSEKAPKGGWLGPPGNTHGLAPEAVAHPGKKGKWRWKDVDHTTKQEKRRTAFFRGMREADRSGETTFEY